MNKGLDKPSSGTERSFAAAVAGSHAEAGVGELTESERGGEGAPLWLSSCRRIELPKGADKPVVWRGGDSVSSALEAYKSLRTRIMRAQASCNFNSVVLTSAAPGDGKTLTAFNLGFCYAQMEETPVLLIDGDLRTKGLSALAGNLESVGLAEVLSGAAEYEDAIEATNVPNLYVTPAGSSDVPPTELFSNGAWKRFLEWSREFFKIVLIDSPPVTPLADFDLIAAECEGILVVVRAHRTRREELEKALARIDSKKLIGVAWNAASSSSQDHYPYYYYGKNR